MKKELAELAGVWHDAAAALRRTFGGRDPYRRGYADATALCAGQLDALLVVLTAVDDDQRK